MQVSRGAGLLRGMVMGILVVAGVIYSQSVAAQQSAQATVVPPVPNYSEGFFELKNVEAGVMERLEVLGIPLEEVNEITYYLQKRSTSGDNERIVGAEAIVRLERCEKGYLALSFTPGGYFRQAYTRFGCEIAGVTAY